MGLQELFDRVHSAFVFFSLEPFSTSPFFFLSCHPSHDLSLSLLSPCGPNSTLALSVLVRKRRGNYVPASTSLSGHSLFP